MVLFKKKRVTHSNTGVCLVLSGPNMDTCMTDSILVRLPLAFYACGLGCLAVYKETRNKSIHLNIALST